MFESMQANKERYQKSQKGMAYFETLAARAAPITTKQMETNANLNGVAQIMNANEGMTKEDATTMFFAKRGFPALQALLSTWGPLPTREEVLNGEIEDATWEMVGADLFKGTGQMVDGGAIKKAYLQGLEGTGYERGYGGHGNSRPSPGQGGGMSPEEYKEQMGAKV